MRAVILGCGSIGRRHLRNLRALGQTDLLAFDPAPVAQEAVSERFGIQCYAVLDDVWAQVPSVALITSPTNLHVELALAAAYHGCHLFIEKPLSHSLDGLDTLCAEVRQRSLITMVGCNMRFHP
ncbi:MAG: Gfo/Idh/MocA family oxidoreductase, partial [Chloroflexi bacterium]|nr:Gfo/Idh/MocA family oxidoreductase [Chloroflexota bacterium]